MKHAAIANCTTKRRYKSKEEANDMALYLFQEKGKYLYVYKCNLCDGWHLSRKP